MSYYPDPNPKKVNGCLESLILTKVAFQVLAPALLFILGSILGIVLLLYAFAWSLWLGLGGLVLAALLIFLLSRWEKRRVARIEAELSDPNLPGPPKVG